MTEPIDYKDFADRFYNLLKENSFYRGLPEFHQVVKEYENLHKPKMKRCPVAGSSIVEILEYDKQQYALFWDNWYIFQCGKLYQVSERSVEELNQAYLEYKNQPKQVRL